MSSDAGRDDRFLAQGAASPAGGGDALQPEAIAEAPQPAVDDEGAMTVTFETPSSSSSAATTDEMPARQFERPFIAGQIVGNRFEIVRRIGEGGMGIVYEAFDRKRGQRIAMKCAKAGLLRSLSPELESALKVRHRNICLVNEIHTATTERGEVDFLTMELLEGQTLHARLATAGPLNPKEAVEIAQQLCSGLSEAHRVGIVHKDLKSANVILTHFPDGSPRAVITDFGLAGERSPDAASFAGTPTYMAPELWQGRTATTASDIYALGVILYEMLTGTRPFTHEEIQNGVTTRPLPPSSRAAGLDRKWDEAVLACLDPSPSARPRDATDVLAPLAKRLNVRAMLLAAVAIVAIAAVALVRMQAPPPPVPHNIRMAILPIEGPPDLQAVGNGAAIDLADHLGHRTGAPTVVVIPASRCVENRVRTPEEARHTLDATHALQITLHNDRGALLLRAVVIDAATRATLYDMSGRYSLADARAVSVALTNGVAKALRLPGPALEPISPAAAAQYLRGLAYLRRDLHSFDAAIPLFRDAIRLDHQSPLPLAGLVEALVLKYDDTKDRRWIREAGEVLQEAQRLAPDSVSVLLAGARLEFIDGQYEKALIDYQRAEALAPRSVEVLLRIAEVDKELNLPNDAVENYRKAIALEPNYYETYEEYGAFLWSRGDYPHAAEQFRKVIALAPRFLNAHTNLGATLSEMGEDAAADQALLDSLRIRETAGALNSLAASKAYQGRDADALTLYVRALALDPKSYICLMNVADSSRRLGHLTEAANYYRQASQVALAELTENPRSGKARAYFAYVASRIGDCGRAEQEIEQALHLSPGEKAVIRRAVITYEVLGQRQRALELASAAPKDVLRELTRQPDLAELRQDPRFARSNGAQ